MYGHTPMFFMYGHTIRFSTYGHTHTNSVHIYLGKRQFIVWTTSGLVLALFFLLIGIL